MPSVSSNVKKPSNAPDPSAKRMTTKDFLKQGRSGVNASTPEPLVEAAPKPEQPSFSEPSDSFSPDGVDFDSIGSDAPDSADSGEDFGWLEGLKQYKQIHGMDTAELLAALSNGEIPQALYDKFLIPMKDGDNEFTMSLAEARDNGMMRANFTRKMQEFSRERKAFEQEKRDIAAMFQGWSSNPATMLAQMEKMKLPVLEVAQLLANRHRDIDQIRAAEEAGHVPAGSAEAYLDRLRLQGELEEAQFARQRLEQSQQQVDTRKDGQAAANKITDTARKFFAAEGLQESQGLWNVFKQELSAIWEVKGTDQAITDAEIRAAVRTTKQIAAQYVQQAKAQQPAAAPAMTARPMDSAGAPVVHRNAKKAPMSAKDFMRQHKLGGIR